MTSFVNLSLRESF